MPMKQPWRLAEVTLVDVRRRPCEVAVLPVGATEPHNMHLPFGTDCFEVTEACDRACAWAWKRGAKVTLLPTLPFGADQNMLAFPMVINLDQDVLDRIVASVAESLERHGVRKLVIVNGHGGNDFQPGLRTLFRRSKLFCCYIDWWQVALTEGGQKILEKPGNHADEMETSLMLEIAPHLVNLEWADEGQVRESRFHGAHKGWAWYPRPWDRLTTNTGVGDPRKGTAAKGRKLLKIAEEQMGRFLLELARARQDKYFPFQPPQGKKGKK
jgi:creatinine amidohydrolase